MANVVEIILAGKDKASGIIGGVSQKVGGLGKVAKVASAAIVAGFAAGLAATIALTRKVATAGDEIAKMARRTGMGTVALSELAFAAEQSGADIQTLENGFRRLQRNVTDAEAGLTTSIRAFERMNIEWKDSEGRLKELDQLLPEISDAMRAMSSDTERSATAQELFGRSGTMLLPLLREGAKGISALREEAHKLGRTWDEVSALQAEEAVDAQNRLRSSLIGVRNTIGQALIPTLSKVATKVGEWIAENRELLAQDIKGVFEAIVSIGETAITVLGDIAAGAKIVAEALGLLKEAGPSADAQERIAEIFEEQRNLIAQQLELQDILTAGAEEFFDVTTATERAWELMGEGIFNAGELTVRILEIEQELVVLDEERLDLALKLNEEKERGVEIEEREAEIFEKTIGLKEQERAIALKGTLAELKGIEIIHKQRQRFHGIEIRTIQEVAARQSETVIKVGNIIESTAAQSFGTFLRTGKGSVTQFFEFAKQKLAELAAHRFFTVLAGTGGGGIFGAIAGIFGSTGGQVRGYQVGTPRVVPGQGTGDRIPAMLEAGEGIIPRDMMQKILMGSIGGGGRGDNTYIFQSYVPMNAEQRVEAARWLDEVQEERDRSF